MFIDLKNDDGKSEMINIQHIMRIVDQREGRTLLMMVGGEWSKSYPIPYDQLIEKIDTIIG